MSQQPQKPSLGRVVLFVNEHGREYAADVVKVNSFGRVLGLHVKMADQTCPILVVFLPLEEGVKDAEGRSWRWPPRV